MSPSKGAFSLPGSVTPPFWIPAPPLKCRTTRHMEKSKSAARRASQRARKAAPCPKPRGRVPRGSNGLPQVWDKERGGWSDADPQPAWAWSSTLKLPELGAATAAAEPAAAEAVVAAPTIVWEAPTFWQLETSEVEESEPCGRTRVHERVQLTPCGSRAHAIEHISPGGTTWHESHISPAGANATRERRGSWRSRIAQARREARGTVVHKRYDMKCAYCGRTRHIMPNGYMFPHSLREAMNTAQRAAYRQSQAYAEHGWQCPGSHEYHGPCAERNEESEEEDSSEDESV